VTEKPLKIFPIFAFEVLLKSLHSLVAQPRKHTKVADHTHILLVCLDVLVYTAVFRDTAQNVTKVLKFHSC